MFRRRSKWIPAFARMTVGAIAAGALAFCASLFVAPYSVTDVASVRGAWRGSDAWLLDRNGEPLSRVRIDHERRCGEWVSVGDVSPALLSHMLASEDRRFRAHAGVDWRAIPAAVTQTIRGGRRGGSTVTMQLAAYLHPELERSGRRSLLDKWRQMRQALAIERRWGKDEILEAWLNLTPFRGELEGIDAASRSLFGKRAAGLDDVESAVLTALVRSPNAPAARVARRACALLANVENACFAARAVAASGLRPRTFDADLDGAAPHLARKLLKRPGENLTSTLDAPLQRFASTTLTRHIRELADRNVEDGAVVVLDNATGHVLAYVGSTGSLSRAQEVDGVTSPRQAGSTLKPFLYALALERTLLTAASIVEDTPLALTLPTGLYVPQNYDHSFKGRVSLREALASSLNVPAVRTLALTGYEPFHRKLKALGLALPRDAEHYGYSLALGGADVTLLELANAYRALANGGRVTPTTVTATVTLTHQGGGNGAAFPSTREGREGGVVRAVDPRAAFIVSDILADPAARALTFGFASPLTTRYHASVKTGTSKDMRDNWAVGYTTRYTVGVWVGNFSGEAMHDVSGVDGAAPVWREIMDYLHEGAAPAPVPAPDGIVRQRVTFTGTLDSARDEWFIAGTQHARVSAIATGTVMPRIETPAQGAIFAVDPDIPRERQRLAVTTRGAPRGARLVLEDGRRVRADRPVLWLPEPGKRVIVLENAAGQELDRVRFEVRGVPQHPRGDNRKPSS